MEELSIHVGVLPTHLNKIILKTLEEEEKGEKMEKREYLRKEGALTL